MHLVFHVSFSLEHFANAWCVWFVLKEYFYVRMRSVRWQMGTMGYEVYVISRCGRVCAHDVCSASKYAQTAMLGALSTSVNISQRTVNTQSTYSQHGSQHEVCLEKLNAPAPRPNSFFKSNISCWGGALSQFPEQFPMKVLC